MCYLIAKHIDAVGCVALKTTHGEHLSKFKRTLEEQIGGQLEAGFILTNLYNHGKENFQFSIFANVCVDNVSADSSAIKSTSTPWCTS